MILLYKGDRMKSNVLLPFYELAKDFIDVVDSNEDMRDLMFQIDQAGSEEELLNIANNDTAFLESFLYISRVRDSYQEIEDYFFDEVINVLQQIRELRLNKTKEERRMEDRILSDIADLFE